MCSQRVRLFQLIWIFVLHVEEASACGLDLLFRASMLIPRGLYVNQLKIILRFL